MFWLGLIIGVFLGVFLGLLLIAICTVAGMADQHIEEFQHYLPDERKKP
jgi:ABC-type uncharacterized transport system permease subunit